MTGPCTACHAQYEPWELLHSHYQVHHALTHHRLHVWIEAVSMPLPIAPPLESSLSVAATLVIRDGCRQYKRLPAFP